MALTLPAVLAASPNSTTYAVVWEWENRQNQWRPYSPEVTQLLERAHQKKLNKIYLKDADPMLKDYYIDMTNFEQICESTGTTYSVRREFYPDISPAGKGAKWEWAGDGPSPEWYIYDMEVQTVVEEAWTSGSQTVDVSSYCPGCPYIINFCNMTQVRKNSGAVKAVRRIAQSPYPMLKLTQAEIAAMIHRREERHKAILASEAERRSKKSVKKICSKKTMKHLISQFLHQRSVSADRLDKVGMSSLGNKLSMCSISGPNKSTPFQASQQPLPRQFVTGPTKVPGYRQEPNPQPNPSSQRSIGHPRNSGAISEYGYPVVTGRRYANGGGSISASQPQRNRRFHDYSSFSETSSIIRRPSVDTISTYLSHESMMRQNYGYFNRSLGGAGSQYGSGFGSQRELGDIYSYDNESDSVFTDDDSEVYKNDQSLKSVGSEYSKRGSNNVLNRTSASASTTTMMRHHSRMPSFGETMSVHGNSIGATRSNNHLNNFASHQRVFSDPSLAHSNGLASNHIPGCHSVPVSPFKQGPSGLNKNTTPLPPNVRPSIFMNHNSANLGNGEVDDDDDNDDEESDMYVNQVELQNWIRQKQAHRYEEIDGEEPDLDCCLSNKSALGTHIRNPSILSSDRMSVATFQSQNSINSFVKSFPKRGATIHDDVTSAHSSPSRPSSAMTLRKRPIPTPRTTVNTNCSTESLENSNRRSFLGSNGKMYSPLDRLILRHAQIVIDPNEANEYCPVCDKHLDDEAAISGENFGIDDRTSVVCLSDCQHKCHVICLKISICRKQVHCLDRQDSEGNMSPTYIECPTCSNVSGIYQGNMPTIGSTMTYKIVPKGLPGYEDYHSIQITYNVQNGIQGIGHPRPGKPYFAIGFPRTAFLPDTEKGRRVLKLLEIAFKQRLTFKISSGGSSGTSDVVVWNDALTHKTEFGPTKDVSKGYPDSNYLDDVMAQLLQFGLTDEEII